MSTSHSVLRDRFHRYAIVLECAVLVGSTSLTSLAFADASFLKTVIPFNMNPTILLAVAGLVTFLATVVQMKMDWGGRSALHAKAAEFVFDLKNELGRIHLVNAPEEREAMFVPARARYEMIGKLTPPIPDHQFLALKRLHCLKIEVSKRLAANPGTWPWLARLQIIRADNFGQKLRNQIEAPKETQ